MKSIYCALSVVCFMVALLTASRVEASGVECSYDSLRRLTRVDYDNGTSIAYTYDSAGNRLSLVSQSTVLQYQDFTYTTNNGTVTITDYTGLGGAVLIPNTIDGLPVTGIGNFAFANCSNLTSVVIPSSVTSVGAWAFGSCSNLVGVYFQGNAPTIGSDLFGGLNNATVYYLPDTYDWGPTFSGRPTVLLSSAWGMLTATAGLGGSIAPSGAVPVPQGSDTNFVITAGGGNHIWQVVVDGMPIGSYGPGSNSTVYAFVNVVTNHTIMALFSADPVGVSPAWWSSYEVLNTNTPVTNDYAAVNLGQLKWIATQASEAMEAGLPGGAGFAVTNMVANFPSNNNFMAANIGQAKAIAKPFYDRLGQLQGVTNYPWTGAAQTNDFGVLNIGQLKNLFSFEVPN